MRQTARRSQSALLKLIGLAYAAAEDRSGWEPFLLALADSVSARATVLLHHDLSAGGSVVLGVRNDPEAARLYNEHYHRIDPRALSPQARTLNLPGRAVPDELLVPYRHVERTSYHQDFTLKFGISRLTSVSLADTVNAFSGLSVLRAHEDKPFGPDELRWLELIAPHAARALRIGDIVAHACHARAAAMHALDAFPTAVLLVDRSSVLIHANRAAHALLKSDDGLRTDRSGLHTSSPAVTATLRKLCADCADTAHGDGLSAGGVLSLARPSGRRNLQLVVAPLSPDGQFARHDSRIAAIAFVSDPDCDARPSLTLLQTLYGLTPTEAVVASHLATGKTLEETCAALGYTQQTMRWYSKQLLNKMHCRSRSQLVRLLSATVASLHLWSDPRQGPGRRRNRAMA